MKFLSWNVNGLRAALRRNFVDYILDENPDMLCIQESKVNDASHLPLNFPPEYHRYWNYADKKGYSGTAIFTKQKPLSVQNDFPGQKGEGRAITLEFDDYYVTNVYVPNAQPELARIDFRMQWDKDLLKHLQSLKKPVLCCGDFNVAHNPIDLARPEANEGHHGYSKQERDGFSNFVDGGFIDTFREFNKEPHQYSWWTYRANARANNVGWRIDYWIASKQLRPRITDAFIQQHIMGSDHCPVGIIFE